MAKYIKITQDNTHTENVTSDVIERLYNYCVGGIEDNSNIIGKVKTTYAYDDECKYLTNKFSDFSIMVGEYYARITDDAARTIILSKWGESDGKHVLASKLATVNSLESVFANTSIKDAKWLSYFTKVTNLSHTFSGVTSTTLDGLEKLDTSMVTNMQNTFDSCKMTKLDVSGWDVSHVTSMSGMFANIAAEELDLTSWNISSITDKTGMFYGARNLKEIKGFESCNISTIGYMMFNGCTNLALTSLPEGVTSIGYAAFASCTSLALTSLPEGVTGIGALTFNDCTNLALTSLPEGVTSIGGSAFNGCTNLALTSLPEGVTSIGNYAFASCTSLALTSLPEGVTSIGDRAFSGCTNLALTSFPEGVTSIGGSAFASCTSLALTSLPEGVTSIGGGAFNNCTKCLFKSDALKNVKSFNIGANTGGGFDSDYFENRQLILGENCVEINIRCFRYAHVDKVKILATTPPALGDKYAFYGDKGEYMQIYVPDASVDTYKTANVWKDIAGYIHPMSEWTD